MSDPLAPLYTAHPDYRAEHDGRFWLVRNVDESGLACGEQIYRIWSSFDGRPTEQVISDLGTGRNIPADLVEAAVRVLARAGLLLPSEPLPAPDRAPIPDLGAWEPLPLVSIIVLAGPRARVHLETCLPSIALQAYPNLEVILVDNQTVDDSIDFVRENYPRVQVLSTGRALGFDAANNLAIRQARGDFILLLNDDTELEHDCVGQCMKVMLQSERTACVVPKMRLFYTRPFLNSIGNSMYPSGQACDNFIGYLDVGQFDGVEQVFSACFGAAVLRRSVVDEIGAMDERYSFYFEDMDWSYRARIRGYEIAAAPHAIVYHKFSATMDTLDSAFKTGLVARNRLRFIWKNLDLGRAWQLTRTYLAESIRHVTWAAKQGKAGIAGTYLRSWGQWFVSWPGLLLARRRIRGRRAPSFSDNEAFALVGMIPQPAMYGRYPVLTASLIREHYMQLEIL